MVDYTNVVSIFLGDASWSSTARDELRWNALVLDGSSHGRYRTMSIFYSLIRASAKSQIGTDSRAGRRE